jgi:hypothetical protein
MKLITKILVFAVLLLVSTAASAQRAQTAKKPAAVEFGPNVRAYLEYLKAETTVTDDRASQHEVSPAFFRRNFNRVNALRQFVLKFARETKLDFVPEVTAVTSEEFHLIFDQNPPKPVSLRVGETYSVRRYLGSVRHVETFYIFARLDPFEEEALRKTDSNSTMAAETEVNVETVNKNTETDAAKNGEEQAKTTQTSTEKQAESVPAESKQPQQSGVPALTRERILYGVGDKTKNPVRQPNP